MIVSHSMENLTPSEVIVESNYKAFTLNSGRSSGSGFTVKYKVPDGMGEKELRFAMLKAKQSLDLLCLTAEMLRGAVPVATFTQEKDSIKKAYARVLEPVMPAGTRDLEPVTAMAQNSETVSTGSDSQHHRDVLEIDQETEESILAALPGRNTTEEIDL